MKAYRVNRPVGAADMTPGLIDLIDLAGGSLSR